MMMFFNSKHGKFCQNTDFCWTAPNIRKIYLYKRQLLATIRKHGASCSMHTPKTEQNTLSFKYFKGISIIKSKNNNLQSTLRGLQLLNESKKSLWITLQDQADSLKPAEKKKSGATQAPLHFSWWEIFKILSHFNSLHYKK